LWGNYPGPSVPPSIPIPPPVETFNQPAGQVNILLLGSDQRPGGSGFRTDIIMLVALNPNLGTANITSFPRDLYVYIPGWTMQRLNSAQQKGGFSLTQATFAYNFGLQPDHYLMVNFWGFVQGIDNLGGINVQVGRTLSDHRDGYGTYTVPAGLVHMDGETALWYVRSRGTSNDFDRNRRQQEVILATFFRLLSLNAIQRAPELYNLYQENVTTDMTTRDITPLLGLATLLANNSSNINSYFISSGEVQAFRVPSSGAQVLLPRTDAVLEILHQALNAE
jgi:LCP family protein required for cell wall assembly